MPYPRRERLTRWGPRLVILWATGVALAAFVVHPTFWLWSNTQASIRDALREHVDRDAVLVSNYMAVRKFLDELDRKYLPLDINSAEGVDTQLVMQRHDEFYVALLDRTDSDYWREEMKKHQPLIDSLPNRELLYDERVTGTDHLRIWRMRSVASDPRSH